MCAIDELVLELTDWCALCCKHCSSESGPHRKTHLRPDVAQGLIEQAASLRANRVSFGGGEPVSSPLLLEALAHVIALGMIPEVFTCGVERRGSHPGPFSDSLVRELNKVKPLSLIFSLHGPDAQTHDHITQTPGSFHAMLNSLDRSVASGIHCEANFVPVRPNVKTFAQAVTLAASRGIRKVSILRFVPQGRGETNRKELELSEEEEDAFIRKLLGIRQVAGLEIRTGSPFNCIIPGNNIPCRAGRCKLGVQADGNVRIGYDMFLDGVSLGKRGSAYVADNKFCINEVKQQIAQKGQYYHSCRSTGQWDAPRR